MNPEMVKARIREAISQAEHGNTRQAALALTWALREVAKDTDERWEEPDTIAGLCTRLVEALRR